MVSILMGLQLVSSLVGVIIVALFLLPSSRRLSENSMTPEEISKFAK
jgi:hypothetical protein